MQEVQLHQDDELFGRGGWGVLAVVKNGNDRDVRVTLEVSLLMDSELLGEVSSGPQPVSARETVLVPMAVDRALGFTDFTVDIVRVTAA